MQTVMIKASAILFIASATLWPATPAAAQDLSRYRDFTLGSTVASVTTATGLQPGAVTLIHQRPAMIQELRWPRQSRSALATTAQADAVSDIVFRFYNDQLFAIIVTYDRQRVEGLTDADLIESLAAVYGQPLIEATTVPAEPKRTSSLDMYDTTIARWMGPESSVSLQRGTYPTAVRLTLSRMQVETLATAASADAVLRDAQEAPQREIDRKSRDTEVRRLATEKARTANKGTFKP